MTGYQRKWRIYKPNSFTQSAWCDGSQLIRGEKLLESIITRDIKIKLKEIIFELNNIQKGLMYCYLHDFCPNTTTYFLINIEYSNVKLLFNDIKNDAIKEQRCQRVKNTSNELLN